ncbi:alpha-L-fucosidase [Lentzea sp. NBRC 105346]|uniref:discoidin domain-containing protein n=1 Tax=Lentzea sp. NBRC 105346 TaxID=3032205 RepID=UPI0024A2571A|nr:discoidin domain-containing protein [Lentzea sp. NBRC 105346]GLZ33355.1 alpha-L-fucosidase [Lentzea sp. NBRC 105346]
MRAKLRRIGVLISAALLVVGLSPGTASAEVIHPRQDWLRASTAGLFLHWGMRTSPGYTSCSAWESAVTGGGWNAKYWVDEAKKLHAQYLVLASFHSRLGYARAWPSNVPGSCATKRDFLGELITAADAQGLKVINYMTDDPQWHAEGGHEWLDSAAYSKYKGKSIDLTQRPGFGQFSYDNFVEVMQRYPKLAGFWIDNDNAYWEQNGLYERIRKERPDMVLSNNNEDTPIMDTISNEQKTGMTPNYDYPQAVYTAAPRLIEACFKLPSSGPWWYGGSNSGVDYKLTLGRLITNAGSDVKALMAETAMVNGKFPSNQQNFNNFAAGYLDQIKEGLLGVSGGGYNNGGLKPGFWNDGAHGITTVSKSNANNHYIHVITKPSGSTLKVRDNGYKVSKVTNLRTGAAVSWTQGGGTLTLSGVSNWDQYDTVFKVETAGREGIIPQSSYTMSASASGSGHPASAAADGNYQTYWDATGAGTVSLRFDLGSAKKVSYVAINQREDSTTYPSSGSARIKNYNVYTSNDGSSWTNVKSGSLPNHRGVQFIDLPANTTARHIRVEKTSTQGKAQLRVDEAWLGSAYANGGGTPTPDPGRYEAENATITQGVVESNHAGFSGTGFVNYDNVVGSAVEWKVNAAQAGPVTLKLRYANGTTANRPLDINVNGALAADELGFAATGAWTTWQDVTVTVNLNAGENVIRATATTVNGGPNVDYLEVGA